MKWELFGLVVFVFLLVYLLSSGPGFTGFAVISDVPSFIPNDARGLVIEGFPNGHSYEYESGGEWRKAFVLVNGDYDSCMNVSEGITDLRLYQVIDGERVDVTFNESYGVRFIDSDTNGLIDKLCWTMP